MLCRGVEAAVLTTDEELAGVVDRGFTAWIDSLPCCDADNKVISLLSAHHIPVSHIDMTEKQPITSATELGYDFPHSSLIFVF